MVDFLLVHCLFILGIYFWFSKGVTSWVKTWKSNGWRLKSGGVIINKDDFQQLDKLNAELDVVWVGLGNLYSQYCTVLPASAVQHVF